MTFETQTLVLDQGLSSRHCDVSPGQYALLAVSDSGKGMDTETLDHIFDPFFTTKEVGKGTGLGLATVYGIIKGHGGQIYCDSQPGQGTSFKIFLPMSKSKPESLSAELGPADNQIGGRETVLLVDDEQALRTLGTRTLEGAGYEVLTASDGEEALAIYQERAGGIDLVIMDLGMPGMGGHKSCQAILALDPRAQVLIASGYAANDQVRAALEAGAAGYVAKPFRKTDLLATIRTVLDRRDPLDG